MAQKNGIQKSDKTKVAGFVIAMLVCLITMLTMMFVCAAALSKEVIGEEYAGYCTVAILLISSAAGAKAAIWNGSGNIFYSALGVGVVYVLLLLTMTILFFEGRFYGVGVSCLVIFSGCILAALPGKKKGKRVKVRRSKKYSC